jgi:iron(III) transport system ATP-binding protein
VSPEFRLTGPDAHAVEARGLRKSFGDVEVLHGVDLDVPSASVLALLGPSGCGKTTLLRSIAGLERTNAGRIRIGSRVVGDDGVHVAPERRRVGMVFQDAALFPHLSVARNVAYGLPRGRERATRVAEVLETVGLDGLGERMPHTLSGGQAQRVALARALAPRPSVLLLDEPFASLDAQLRAQLREEVPRILRESGTAALFVTHDQEEALQIGDEIAVMLEGRIRHVGSPAEIYDLPSCREVAEFVGDANLLPGLAAAGSAVTVLGTVPVYGDVTGRVQVLVRPERVEVRADGTARVTDVEFHGHDTVYRIAAADGSPVRARVLGAPALAPGDRCHIGYRGCPTLAYGATEQVPERVGDTR